MIVLINPNIQSLRSDPFTTGIPFMPIGLAYAAAALQQAGETVQVIDAFGEAPTRIRKESRFLIHGLHPEESIARIPASVDAAVLYAGILASHLSLLSHLRTLKAIHPSIPAIVIENTQAVTAYALEPVKSELFQAGADFVLTGEPEERLPALVRWLRAPDTSPWPDGVWGASAQGPSGRPADHAIADLNGLPFPAWTLFPVQHYWALRYSHGPVEGPFLPLLTSRGCPYPCRFCVVPATNQRSWRARSPVSVVNEMTHWQSTLGVSEFHWEDLNPTIQDARIREIADTILSRKLAVRWKLAAGTKLETLKSPDTVAAMAQAGCRYVSFSPESGSPAVLEAIDKAFDFDHADRMVRLMDRHGIRTQACFVLGFPRETDHDRTLTWKAVKRLVRQGLDELALFIITPVPGSAIFPDFQGFETLSQLNFSPTWRNDFKRLSRFRLRLYFAFLFWKLRYSPRKLLRQPFNFLRRRFETKMEMTPYRACSILRHAWRSGKVRTTAHA